VGVGVGWLGTCAGMGRARGQPACWRGVTARAPWVRGAGLVSSCRRPAARWRSRCRRPLTRRPAIGGACMCAGAARPGAHPPAQPHTQARRQAGAAGPRSPRRAGREGACPGPATLPWAAGAHARPPRAPDRLQSSASALHQARPWERRAVRVVVRPARPVVRPGLPGKLRELIAERADTQLAASSKSLLQLSNSLSQSSWNDAGSRASA